MAYPARRGGDRGWSLVQLAAEARASRWAARTAVARGLLGPPPYREDDAVLLRVAAAVLALPGPPGLAAAAAADVLERRDKDAVRFARALLADPTAGAGAAVVVSSREAAAADTPAEVQDALLRMYPEPALVLPVGGWRLSLPSQREAARGRLFLADFPA